MVVIFRAHVRSSDLGSDAAPAQDKTGPPRASAWPASRAGGILLMPLAAFTGPTGQNARIPHRIPREARLSGVFRDPGSRREYAYFGDAVTHKVLLIYSLDSGTVDTVPLARAMERVGEVASLALVAADTVIVSGMYTNRLAVIDGRGDVIRESDLTRSLTRSDGARYEIWASPTSSFLMGRRCWFEIDLVASSLEGADSAAGTAAEEIVRFYRLRSTIPRLAWVDPFLPEPVATLALDSFYHRLRLDGFDTSEPSRYSCTNGCVFAYSSYSPVIHVLRGEDGSLLKVLEVRSVHTPVSMRPIRLDGTDMNLQDSVNARLPTEACIQTVAFDASSAHYAVVLVHRIPPDARPEELGAARPFSIIEYDTAFRFVRETAYPGREFYMFSILEARNGLYMQRWEDKDSIRSGTHRFERIRLDGA